MKLGVPKKAVEKSEDLSETRNSFHHFPVQDVATQASVRVLSPLTRRSLHTTWPGLMPSFLAQSEIIPLKNRLASVESNSLPIPGDIPPPGRWGCRCGGA